MGSGQYECEVKGCKEYWKYSLALLTDDEHRWENLQTLDAERYYCLCEIHAMEIWHDAITDVYAFEEEEE